MTDFEHDMDDALHSILDSVPNGLPWDAAVRAGIVDRLAPRVAAAIEAAAQVRTFDADYKRTVALAALRGTSGEPTP